VRAKYVAGWLGHKPDILAKYGEQVVARGFNAVVDDNGRTVGEMPLILFTANKDLISRGAEKVDRLIEEQSQQLYSSKDAKKYRKKTAGVY
jgi:hypothetical protein